MNIYDTFIWFFGVVEDNRDPLEVGRVRVRCFNYHTADTDLLPTRDLPWAQVIRPTNASSVGDIGISGNLLRGAWVFGFFADGESKQRPFVVGTVQGIAGQENVNAGAPTSTGFRDPQEMYPNRLEQPDTNRLGRSIPATGLRIKNPLGKTRGARNNNPGNIESNQYTMQYPGWIGSDGRFAIFASPEDGIRAHDRLLRIYNRKYGLDTVGGIINRWAPDNENDTSAYQRRVAKETGFGINEKLDMNNPQVREKIANAMWKVELGNEDAVPFISRSSNAYSGKTSTDTVAVEFTKNTKEPNTITSTGAPVSVTTSAGAPVSVSAKTSRPPVDNPLSGLSDGINFNPKTNGLLGKFKDFNTINLKEVDSQLSGVDVSTISNQLSNLNTQVDIDAVTEQLRTLSGNFSDLNTESIKGQLTQLSTIVDAIDVDNVSAELSGLQSQIISQVGNVDLSSLQSQLGNIDISGLADGIAGFDISALPSQLNGIDINTLKSQLNLSNLGGIAEGLDVTGLRNQLNSITDNFSGIDVSGLTGEISKLGSLTNDIDVASLGSQLGSLKGVVDNLNVSGITSQLNDVLGGIDANIFTGQLNEQLTTIASGLSDVNVYDLSEQLSEVAKGLDLQGIAGQLGGIVDGVDVNKLTGQINGLALNLTCIVDGVDVNGLNVGLESIIDGVDVRTLASQFTDLSSALTENLEPRVQGLSAELGGLSSQLGGQFAQELGGLTSQLTAIANGLDTDALKLSIKGVADGVGGLLGDLSAGITGELGEIANKLGPNDPLGKSIREKINGIIHPSIISRNAYTDDLIKEPIPIRETAYPFNNVTETESGHVFEMDDTPGSDRITMFHNSGSFTETHPNGTKVDRVVNDKYEAIFGNDSIRVRGNVKVFIDGDSDIYVRQNAKMQVDGNMRTYVGGDYSLDVAGTYNVRSDGNFAQDTNGTYTIQSDGDMEHNTAAEYDVNSQGRYRSRSPSVEIHAGTNDLELFASDNILGWYGDITRFRDIDLSKDPDVVGAEYAEKLPALPLTKKPDASYPPKQRMAEAQLLTGTDILKNSGAQPKVTAADFETAKDYSDEFSGGSIGGYDPETDPQVLKWRRKLRVGSPAPASILGGTIDTFTAEQTRAIYGAIGAAESGNDYTAINQIHYAGKYQFGREALISTGYMHASAPRGNRTSMLNAKNWTGKNGVNNFQDWLANKNNAQELAVVDYSNQTIAGLKNFNSITGAEDPGRRAGIMLAAHLLGAAGATLWLEKGVGADGNNTPAQKYFAMGQLAIENSIG